MSENIWRALDDGNIGCGVFVDLQKAFNTVDHQILLAKLNHYGIHGVLNDWFKHYPSNWNQYVSVNVYESGLTALRCDVPQGSALGPLLFSLAIYKRPSSKNKILKSSPICWWHWSFMSEQLYQSVDSQFLRFS